VLNSAQRRDHILLTREDDGEEDGLSVYPKRRKTLCRLPKPEPNAEYQCRAPLLTMGAREDGGGRRDLCGQARLVGAGEANGGGKLPALCLSPAAPNTREAAGPNP